MATISVIVPVYNTERYLERCVDSLLGQSYTDLELLLVDDGSTDFSGQICDDYALKDSRVKVFHLDNKGPASARNYAIDWVLAYSESMYISFADSDDWVHPEYLKLLYDAIIQYDVQVSQCKYCKTNNQDINTIVSGNFQCITPEEQYKKWYNACAWGKLYKTSIFSSVRFPEGIVYEDLAIWYKILFSLDRIAIVEDVLYYSFYRADSIVNSAWTPKNITRIKIWNEQLVYFESYKNGMLINEVANHYCRIAKEEYDSIRASIKLSKWEKIKYSSLLSKYLRKALTKHQKEIKNNPEYNLFWEIAYPHISSIIWKLRSIKNTK